MSIATSYANYSPDWWTPEPWRRWISRTFRTTAWFDPCPGDWSPSEPSGLDVRWDSPCYLNHPGGRGEHLRWWAKYITEQPCDFIWCAFNAEQLRHLRPSPLALDGWLVLPRQRIRFVWGGATFTPARGKPRVHGEPARSPGNWAVFWSTVRPAQPPAECELVRTLARTEWRGQTQV